MNKCDSCGKFGELEEVQITIKKHKNCDINGAFEKQTIIENKPTDLTQKIDLPRVNPAAPYVNTELEKMIIK